MNHLGDKRAFIYLLSKLQMGMRSSKSHMPCIMCSQNASLERFAAELLKSSVGVLISPEARTAESSLLSSVNHPHFTEYMFPAVVLTLERRGGGGSNGPPPHRFFGPKI